MNVSSGWKANTAKAKVTSRGHIASLAVLPCVIGVADLNRTDVAPLGDVPGIQRRALSRLPRQLHVTQREGVGPSCAKCSSVYGCRSCPAFPSNDDDPRHRLDVLGLVPSVQERRGAAMS